MEEYAGAQYDSMHPALGRETDQGNKRRRRKFTSTDNPHFSQKIRYKYASVAYARLGYTVFIGAPTRLLWPAASDRQARPDIEYCGASAQHVGHVVRPTRARTVCLANSRRIPARQLPNHGMRMGGPFLVAHKPYSGPRAPRTCSCFLTAVGRQVHRLAALNDAAAKAGMVAQSEYAV